MGEIVNLNQYRKALRHLKKERQSTENRVKFGRLKAEREALEREKSGQAHHLDLVKIENPPRPDPQAPGEST